MRIVHLASLSLCALCAFVPYLAQARPLVLAIGRESDTGFDPLYGWGSYGNPLFQSTLLKRGADLISQADLATTWQLSDDRLTWTITLRDDVRFSNGEKLRAADVAFTFNHAKTLGSSVDLQLMVDAQALDETTLTITLSRPWITFSEVFYTLGIVPQASYDRQYAQNPIGSGPYQLRDWRKGEQLIIEPNPYYYGPKAEFEQITFLFTSEEASLAAAKTRQAHLVALPPALATIEVTGYHKRALPSVDNRGLSLPFLPPHSRDGLEIGHPVTSDLAIRRAINFGINRDILVEAVLQGYGRPAYSPADQLPWGPKSQQQNPEPAEVLAALEAAGWQLGSDGIREKLGQKAEFPIYYAAGDSTRQALAEATAALLIPLGLRATPRGASWDMIAKIMHSQPVIFGFGSHSPYEIYSLFSSNLAGIGWGNPSFYANTKVDALFSKAQNAPTLEASFPDWAEASAIYGAPQDHAWAWLVNLDHVYLIDDCLSLGEVQIQPHGHGWPITALIENWRWRCE